MASTPRAAITLSAGFAVALLAPTSSAFCRATTCDPNKGDCPVDADRCKTTGHPLFWSSSCVTIGVQKDAGQTQGIDYDTFAATVDEAVSTWMSVDCGGGAPPSIGVENLGPIVCGEPEYNQGGGNANIVMFREDAWPYSVGSDALARTRLVFDPSSGLIDDADIEINAVDASIGVDDPARADLLSILTHEMGHFLGLAHSSDQTATMRDGALGYDPGDTSLRTLGSDDVAGICAIYPPDRTPSSASCTPRHGFSSECGGGSPPKPATSAETAGCSIAHAPAPSDRSLGLVLVTALSATVARRRQIASRAS